MRRAIVVGALGQDGRLLLERLAPEYGVLAIDLGVVVPNRLPALELPPALDLRRADDVGSVVAAVIPDEIYYLAAHHRSSEERADEAAELGRSFDVHVLGLVNFLEAIRARAPQCRLFYAGSSQMFGEPRSAYQNEVTPFAPRNAYAITKVAGAHACAMYRERGVYACVGILYNHESPLRGPRFVTQRIARGARRAQRDAGHKLKLGSLAAVVDWGYAPDYVDAMVRILAQPDPGDYVVATGEGHSVGEFVEIAFGHVCRDWRSHVEEDASLVTTPSYTLLGDATKLRDRTGWKPSLSFESLVRLMVDAATD